MQDLAFFKASIFPHRLSESTQTYDVNRNLVECTFASIRLRFYICLGCRKL